MNQVPAGISIRASLIPDNGGISTRHGFQPTVGDTVTRFLSGNVVTYVYGEGGVWDPAEPTIASGEGVLINAQNPFVWTRYFSTGR